MCRLDPLGTDSSALISEPKSVDIEPPTTIKINRSVHNSFFIVLRVGVALKCMTRLENSFPKVQPAIKAVGIGRRRVTTRNSLIPVKKNSALKYEIIFEIIISRRITTTIYFKLLSYSCLGEVFNLSIIKPART